MEINPFDKINEILKIFRVHEPKVFEKADVGYDWLEEDDSKCIVFETHTVENALRLL